MHKKGFLRAECQRHVCLVSNQIVKDIDSMPLCFRVLFAPFVRRIGAHAQFRCDTDARYRQQHVPHLPSFSSLVEFVLTRPDGAAVVQSAVARMEGVKRQGDDSGSNDAGGLEGKDSVDSNAVLETAASILAAGAGAGIGSASTPAASIHYSSSAIYAAPSASSSLSLPSSTPAVSALSCLPSSSAAASAASASTSSVSSSASPPPLSAPSPLRRRVSESDSHRSLPVSLAARIDRLLDPFDDKSAAMAMAGGGGAYPISIDDEADAYLDAPPKICAFCKRGRDDELGHVCGTNAMAMIDCKPTDRGICFTSSPAFACTHHSVSCVEYQRIFAEHVKRRFGKHCSQSPLFSAALLLTASAVAARFTTMTMTLSAR